MTAYYLRLKLFAHLCPPDYVLAGADGNRTHRGLRQPTTGFEVRERHQAANYPRVPNIYASRY
jgi:hypothetical protein